MELFSLEEQIVWFTVIILTVSVLFRNKLATGIHSLLDVRRSDSSTEEASMFVETLQVSKLLIKNSKLICLK